MNNNIQFSRQLVCFPSLGLPNPAFQLYLVFQQGKPFKLRVIQQDKQQYMSHRPFSVSEAAEQHKSLQKENERKLRAAGSMSHIIPPKTLSLLSDEGQTIGDYVFRKKDLIGQGYTSKVYKCRSIKREGQFALKVIDTNKYSASSIDMLDNQINILQDLQHPNVIKFENVYKDAQSYFLVTQFCPQGDLMEYLTRHGKLAEKEAIAIISEVIEGAKFLFKKGIVHRDIKPANILKTHSHWKIADFGFAIRTEVQIKTRQNVGTPLYMPLQSLLRNLYSPESDIFSIGVIFYEIMVGLTPWESRSQRQLIRKMSTTPFDIPEKYKVTSSIKYLLSKMCQPTQENRMTKQQFLDINIKNFASIIDFSQKLKVQATKRKPRIFSVGKSQRQAESKRKSKVEAEYLTNRKASKNQVKNTPKLQYRSSSKNKGEVKAHSSRKKNTNCSTQKAFQQKLQNENYEVLVNQLNYCRFLYYFIQNGVYLQLSWASKGRLTLVVFKHILKIIKQLADSKNNWFGLTNWDTFRKSAKFVTTLKTLREYCQKYEREYLIFLKRADFNVIKDVNQKLPEFTSCDPLTIPFYRKILNFITPFIKECSQNTLHLTEEEMKKGEGSARVEALGALFRYFRLIEMSMNMFQNFSCFKQHCHIVILKNYRMSKAGGEELQLLRQEAKRLE